ncbi:unnamed protein product [Chrysoparadoxa australica]
MLATGRGARDGRASRTNTGPTFDLPGTKYTGALARLMQTLDTFGGSLEKVKADLVACSAEHKSADTSGKLHHLTSRCSAAINLMAKVEEALCAAGVPATHYLQGLAGPRAALALAWKASNGDMEEVDEESSDSSYSSNSDAASKTAAVELDHVVNGWLKELSRRLQPHHAWVILLAVAAKHQGDDNVSEAIPLLLRDASGQGAGLRNLLSTLKRSMVSKPKGTRRSQGAAWCDLTRDLDKCHIAGSSSDEEEPPLMRECSTGQEESAEQVGEAQHDLGLTSKRYYPHKWLSNYGAKEEWSSSHDLLKDIDSFVAPVVPSFLRRYASLWGDALSTQCDTTRDDKEAVARHPVTSKAVLRRAALVEVLLPAVFQGLAAHILRNADQWQRWVEELALVLAPGVETETDEGEVEGLLLAPPPTYGANKAAEDKRKSSTMEAEETRDGSQRLSGERGSLQERAMTRMQTPGHLMARSKVKRAKRPKKSVEACEKLGTFATVGILDTIQQVLLVLVFDGGGLCKACPEPFQLTSAVLEAMVRSSQLTVPPFTTSFLKGLSHSSALPDMQEVITSAASVVAVIVPPPSRQREQCQAIFFSPLDEIERAASKAGANLSFVDGSKPQDLRVPRGVLLAPSSKSCGKASGTTSSIWDTVAHAFSNGGWLVLQDPSALATYIGILSGNMMRKGAPTVLHEAMREALKTWVPTRAVEGTTSLQTRTKNQSQRTGKTRSGGVPACPVSPLIKTLEGQGGTLPNRIQEAAFQANRNPLPAAPHPGFRLVLVMDDTEGSAGRSPLLGDIPQLCWWQAAGKIEGKGAIGRSVGDLCHRAVSRATEVAQRKDFTASALRAAAEHGAKITEATSKYITMSQTSPVARATDLDLSVIVDMVTTFDMAQEATARAAKTRMVTRQSRLVKTQSALKLRRATSQHSQSSPFDIWSMVIATARLKNLGWQCGEQAGGEPLAASHGSVLLRTAGEGQVQLQALAGTVTKRSKKRSRGEERQIRYNSAA